MKKMILMAAMLVAAVSANAQARFEAGSLTLQPRIGSVGAMFTNTPSMGISKYKSVDATAIGGAMIGVDAEYYFTDRFSVAGGVGLAQAGTGWKKFDYVDGGTKSHVKDTKIQTAYFNIPVTANWYVAKGLALKAGVQFGFLTKANFKSKITAENGSASVTEKIDESCKDDLKKFDLSIPVGLSYEFKFPLVIDARYNFGVTKVNKDKDPDEKDSRNIVFMLSVGYKFKL